jgi:hypothetical protein
MVRLLVVSGLSSSEDGLAPDKVRFANWHGGPWSVQVTLSAEWKSPY